MCKSHTCEKLDEINIEVLSAIERKTGLQKQLEKREPRLKSYLRQRKCFVTGAVIPALLKLVANEGYGKTTSLATFTKHTVFIKNVGLQRWDTQQDLFMIVYHNSKSFLREQAITTS